MKMAIIMNHKLTKAQLKEAKESLGVTSFIELPETYQKFWSNIPPEGSIYTELMQDFINWLNTLLTKGDALFVQGDFGATVLLVSWAFNKDIIPYYATTRRNVKEVETKEGTEIIRSFDHVKFRAYEWFGSD